MGSGSYALRSQLNNKDAVGIGIFQSPGANAIDLSNAVRAKMDELSTRFPEDMKWAAPYDPTVLCATPSARWCKRCWKRWCWWCWW
jgi:multidrug efflux pump